MDEAVDFALFCNTNRWKETQYMNREELEEMYKYYLETLER